MSGLDALIGETPTTPHQQKGRLKGPFHLLLTWKRPDQATKVTLPACLDR
jgi:hypothetical protein